MRERALPKGDDSDTYFCSLGSSGIGHPKGFELSGCLELVSLRVAMVNLSFAPEAGSRRDAQSCPCALGA